MAGEELRKILNEADFLPELRQLKIRDVVAGKREGERIHIERPKLDGRRVEAGKRTLSRIPILPGLSNDSSSDRHVAKAIASDSSAMYGGGPVTQSMRYDGTSPSFPTFFGLLC